VVTVVRPVKKKYDTLKPKHFLKKQIDSAYELMQSDTNPGDYIDKKPWPDKYLAHHVTTLYVYRLGGSDRMIYTIRTDPDSKYYQILDVLTHIEYNRIFGY
jgi:hypothetical protein